MPLNTDQTGNTIRIESAKRIVSLVPSHTELLYDLGLDEDVAGITKFCVRPETWFKHKRRVGGTKDIKIDVIHALQPDLIIANKEENVKEQVEVLMQHYPVWTSDVNDLGGALHMIASLGEITETADKAKALIEIIEREFVSLHHPILNINPDLSAAYLIWKDPYMAAGGDTFINNMMLQCGFRNIFQHKPRYPVVTIDDIQSAGCKLLLLSSEPYPFNKKHLPAIQRELSGTKIFLVDGEMFSWYGSRLIYAPSYFKKLLQQISYELKEG